MTNPMSPEDHLRARIESQRQEIEQLRADISQAYYLRDKAEGRFCTALGTIEQLHAAVKTAQELAARRLMEIERLREVLTIPNITPDTTSSAFFIRTLSEHEKGQPVNAQDLINALMWRVKNQRKEIARLQEKHGSDKLCPHGMPLADNTCGPCSKGKPNAHEPRACGWRPIEAAPKGGAWVLLWWPDITDCAIVGYQTPYGWHSAVGGGYESGDKYGHPTHWMPLPKSPAEGASRDASSGEAAAVKINPHPGGYED